MCWWSTEVESCDEELQIRTEKLLVKRVRTVTKKLVFHCLVAHPVNLPLGNGMKYSQIRLVVLRAIDFARIEKELEDMEIEAEQVNWIWEDHCGHSCRSSKGKWRWEDLVSWHRAASCFYLAHLYPAGAELEFLEDVCCRGGTQRQCERWYKPGPLCRDELAAVNHLSQTQSMHVLITSVSPTLGILNWLFKEKIIVNCNN